MKHWKFMFNDDCYMCLSMQDKSICPFHHVCKFPWITFFVLIICFIVKAFIYLVR